MKNGHAEDSPYNHDDERLTSRYDTVSQQVEAGLALYGSVDNWPTLRLDAGAFVMCVCGKKRSQHKIGSDESPFIPAGKTTHECNQFTWAGGAMADRRGRRARRNPS